MTICENANPPTTATPNGRRDAAVAPTPMAIGKLPTMAATVVTQPFYDSAGAALRS